MAQAGEDLGEDKKVNEDVHNLFTLYIGRRYSGEGERTALLSRLTG